MKKIKTILIVVTLFLAGIAAVLGIKVARTYFSGAAGATEPENVRIMAAATSATITWQTTKPVMGVVEYGANQANLLLRALETSPTTVHRVILSPLKPATTYYFRIRVENNVYDNSGIPYSFQTKAETKATLSPTQMPLPSLQPTSETAPSASKTGQLVFSCQAADFKKKFGSHDSRYDFDHNGVVNTQDWLECLQQKAH